MLDFINLTGSKGINPILFLVPQENTKLFNQLFVQPYFSQSDVTLATLPMNNKKAPVVSDTLELLTEWLPTQLATHGVKYLVVTQPDYFKRIAKVSKADVYAGYVLPSIYPDVFVVYAPNYVRYFYDPDKIARQIDHSLGALIKHVNGTYVDPGQGIIHTAHYPNDLSAISIWLKQLMTKPILFADIEAFSLNYAEASIGTLGLAWDKNSGIAFDVSYDTPRELYAGYKDLLKDFFTNYKGTVVWHNASYDISAIIHELWMDDITDTKGLLEGLEIMTRNFEDTKIIAYLALNSCSGNELGLKSLAHDFAGNYAEDVKDITKVPKQSLLQYNLVDCLSTAYVFEKYLPIMIAEDQEDLYRTHFKGYLKDIIQMQLTGLPMDMTRVLEVEQILTKDSDDAINSIINNKYVQSHISYLVNQHMEQRNAVLKTKTINADEAYKEIVKKNKGIIFNPRSDLQLCSLLFDSLELPVIELTDNKNPSVAGSVIEDLRNHTDDPSILDFLNSLLDFIAVDKILTSFIPAFKRATYSKARNWHYLIGSFNLGGTVSGRLSSSSPNLQQLPSGGRYGSLVKSCFSAPEGYLLIGLDYSSLEDKISALLTKDTNKIKVYLDHYDGHCLRAYSYFKQEMPDIEAAFNAATSDSEKVRIINSIKKLYPLIRDKSKAPTFLKTYGGTWRGLVSKAGMTETAAKELEDNFNTLYAESLKWTQAKLDQAAIDGYVTVAFGLRVRTPILHQVVRGTKSTPYEAEAEGRTAGNALGQSYGLLNNRAMAEFLSLVRDSKFATQIRPCAAIHDASYYEVPQSIEPVLFTNEHLVNAVNWNDDPAIYHPDINLGGELSVFYPAWHHEIELPNGASKEEISLITYKAMEKYFEDNQQT